MPINLRTESEELPHIYSGLDYIARRYGVIERFSALTNILSENEMCLRCHKSFSGITIRRFQTHLGHYCKFECFVGDYPEVSAFINAWCGHVSSDEVFIFDTLSTIEEEWQCKKCKAINPIIRGKCWLCGN